MKTELNELLEFAVDLARGAGEITLKYFRKQPETSTKSDGSYVTIADREAEAYLRKQINERFPDDGILGEEEGELEGRSGRRWILDPIDGTKGFLRREQYAIALALRAMGVGPGGEVITAPMSAASSRWCRSSGPPTRASWRRAAA